jgi:glycosyltransferase involved in cell wall biosynthesis
MHIAIFLDQNPNFLGGAQRSALNHAKYLRLAGHRVSFVAPRAGFAEGSRDDIFYPSFELKWLGDIAAPLGIVAPQRYVHQAFAERGIPDLVHVQGEFMAALLGNKFAFQLDLPVVQTLHTNLRGIRDSAGRRLTATLIRFSSRSICREVPSLGLRRTSDVFEYLNQICNQAKVVVAPSKHWAKEVMSISGLKHIRVVPNGFDDDVFASIAKPTLTNVTPELIWSGRFSAEKGFIDCIYAVAAAKRQTNERFHVKFYGAGVLEAKGRRLVRRLVLQDRISFLGPVPHREMLLALSGAQAVLQTNLDSETQGMTVMEAGVLQTPAIIRDPKIAAELPVDSYWLAQDSTIDGLGRAIAGAVDDIASGDAKPADFGETFLQSKQTEDLLKLYERALG